MRSSLTVILFVTILFGGGYFYYIAQAICPVPLGYAIGYIDDSFDLTLDEARVAISAAESIWEDATGQNLLTYDPDAKFTINFVYDERQQITDAEGNFKERLDHTESVSDGISDTYERLVATYNDLQIGYGDTVEKYERNLAAHNTQVQQYNEEGGAPKEVYEVLQERKDELDVEQEELNGLSEQLNVMVEEINSIGNQGNRLIETYNKGVAEYNSSFGDHREFVQGTYSSDGRIDIYAFADEQELQTVLAHEFGHALSLDHVADEESVMYFLIGEQLTPLELTENDIKEFVRVCSNTTVWDIILERVFNK
jgi:uncharacterized phage infection (PIP) family protein YhgE